MTCCNACSADDQNKSPFDAQMAAMAGGKYPNTQSLGLSNAGLSVPGSFRIEKTG